MAILKCKMCGGELYPEGNSSICECEYCGVVQTIPVIDSEKKGNLFLRADRLRSACVFDKAASVYENIISEYPEEPEAYWGMCLCKYGIEYVEDPATGKKVPTCHCSSVNSIFDDPDFEMVMEYCDSDSKSIYREEAKKIEMIRESIMEISEKEEPYDIFICYKETDEEGQRTIDSVIAEDIYNALVSKGYRVFFSRITLEDKLGTEYEPYIFAALNSARIMLVVGTTYEHFTAVWVKNEWSRYLKLMASDKDKNLIPCFKDVDVYDIPKEFRKYQSQDMGKVGAIQDLLRGIDKIIKKEPAETSSPFSQFETILKNREASSQQKRLRRGIQALEDQDHTGADRFFDEALNEDIECADAYFGKLLAYYKCSTIQDLANIIVDRFFPKKWVAVWPECSVMDMLQKHFRFHYAIDPVSRIVLDNTHMKLLARKTTNEADISDGILKIYLEKTAAPSPVRSLYTHFVEYYKDETPHLFSTDLLKNCVEDAISQDKKTYEQISVKCSKAELLKTIQNLPDPVSSYIAEMKEDAARRIRYNSEQIQRMEAVLTQLSGLGSMKKRGEIKKQITELQAKNEKIHKDCLDRNMKPEEVLSIISVGKFLRKQLAGSGFVEVFPENRLFKFGRWKNESKESQPILWKTIAKDSNSGHLLIVSDYVLDVISYAKNIKEITWAESDLRKFLNKTFFAEAFNDAEKEAIIGVSINPNPNGDYKDRVFCLSLQEYTDLMNDPQTRLTGFTPYADKKIGRKAPFIWTRDNGRPLYNGKNASFVMVDCDGNIITVDNQLGKPGGVRPAMWIDVGY